MPIPRVPTVADLLVETSIGSSLHRWHVEGGAITVDRAALQAALEDAYDPLMASWPAMVRLGAGRAQSAPGALLQARPADPI